MIVKVCGMREPDNIRAVEQLGADWLGFIFWPKSSRYVAAVPDYLPLKAKRVGVFVDAPVDCVLQHVEVYGLHFVQLHGHETPQYVQELRSRCNVGLIKAISVSSQADVMVSKDYEGLVDYFLFDTKCKTVGGSGEHFDWSVLTAYKGNTPFLLSGGIGPGDTARLQAFCHPRCIGIDLNSRFELSPALKDANLLQTFVAAYRNHTQSAPTTGV